MTTLDKKTLHAWLHHWRDESDAAYLYGVLAGEERRQANHDVFLKLQAVERRHTEMWAKLLAEHGHPVPSDAAKPTLNARFMAWLGRRFGPRYLLPLLLREEGREVKGYMDLHRRSSTDDARSVSLTLAKESAAHAETLANLAGRASEPWHRTSSGGFLRNVVYGFNDGLTANFGLVAGVIGAATVNQHQAVVVAGVAGLIADALSMGSSGYLASKSEREVYEYEISMEKAEVELMPEIERDELAIIYEAKGMDRNSAHTLATQIMTDPQQMLKEQVQEELKIGEFSMSPFREGWITGLATAFGAAIPVFPFLVWHGATAIVISFTVAMLSHFLVGAARSVFTGRGAFRSGLDMFVVGVGVALVGYYVGGWVCRRI